ncbi:RimJ/RimL family protein N-acetyltransferase [Streptomyces sp. SAI-144]|nr:RimJ/RimL family protein N-acetyltransferase [Streptomyces sp. SAI-144]MDH6484638.1 RimJ/RimL family protein N-acetyltransferase [Streptomyces sp. SAI-127]
MAVIRVEPENSVSAAVALRAGFVYRERACAEDGTWLDWYVRNLGKGWTAPATLTSTGSAR